ncbi:hypothetical protein [Halocalculus aciditolerans]|uniref:PIN domain-containing protein n=1 Tax=Halocalculus aciditolerans TaxID=1383812 RepID=A0A830FLC6_9EURY|nr:hypothetical protein [Halocalculus aciditolerans]GGL67100.1 hypothetical protein GCM10009039_26350 [Halocalculus aciditolerans]
MARYFLDNGLLIGLTFLHDAWRDEAERLFDTENALFVNEAVIYDYCNRTRENSLEEADVDWDTEEGVFGKKLSPIRAAQFNLDLKMESLTDEELDLETLVDSFLEESQVKKKTDEDLIEEYIRPRIRGFLEEEIDGRPITTEVAAEVMETLCDTIQTQAREKREVIRTRVRDKDVKEEQWQQYTDPLGFVDGYVDTVILSSVAWLSDRNFLQRIVTSDASDMYNDRDRIRASVGINVVFIKDEFANPSETAY